MGDAKLAEIGQAAAGIARAPREAPSRLRVGYLINQYPKVSHSFIRREILALEAHGVEVDRFTVRPPGELVDPDDRTEAGRTRVLLGGSVLGLLGLGLRELCTRPGPFLRAWRLAVRLGRGSARGVPRHIAYLLEAVRLRRWLAAADVPHLHAHFGTNSATVALLCRVLGGPGFSFTVHGPEEFDAPGPLALAEKIARAEFVVAISSYGRSQLFRWCPFDAWDKVHVVRCAVDGGWLAEPPTPVDATSRRLVCVGRLCEQKGQALLLAAAARLHAEGIDFRLVLVGDGEMRRPLEARIAEHGLGTRVEITGWASGDQVRAHLHGARALVLPSFAEGLPVVIMEALALGRPVLSTSVAGIPELVRPGENGWLVPAGDVDALTDAMRRVLTTDGATLTRMGQAGRLAVEARHRAATEADTLRALFAAAVARPRSP